MWIIIWKNVFDSWSPWPGPRGCFGALSALVLREAAASTRARRTLNGREGETADVRPPGNLRSNMQVATMP